MARLRSDVYKMAFSQKTYMFCHNVGKNSMSKQPVLFTIDLRELISPFGGGCSPMFVIERMSLQAYRRDTSERIPAKFAVLNYAKNKVVTNDTSRLSSVWEVPLTSEEPTSVRIAGTDSDDFCRTVSTNDDDNRLALLNVLGFMMTGSVQASKGARSSLEAMKDCASSEHFAFSCGLCGRECEATVIACKPGFPSLSLPLCVDGFACVPEQSSSMSPKARTYRSLISLLRTAYEDNLTLVDRAVKTAFENWGDKRYFRHGDRQVEVFPHPLILFVVSLYDTLSEQANNFVAVNDREPGVKVLVESPAEKLGYVRGSVTLTLLYGDSVLDVYRNVSAQPGSVDSAEDTLDVNAAVSRLGCDALLRRFPLDFQCEHRHLTIAEWCGYGHV